MLNFGNKEFRNLQEQVYENMKNIEKIQDVKVIGVDVNYIVDTVAEMEEIENPEAGNVCAVGTEPPFTLYVYYEDEWVSLGEFPRQGSQGPQGEQGIQGQRGPQGPMGPQGPVGPRGYSGAPGPQGPEGQRGPQGPQGVQGPQGEQGIPGQDGADGTTPHIDSTTGDWFIGDTDTGVHAQGPQGEQGIQGPQGPVGPAPVLTMMETNPTVPSGTTPTALTGLKIDEDYYAIASTPAWGDITGTLSDQTDLANALAAKANSADLATVATTGDYDDLIDKPDLSIYATTSDLTAGLATKQNTLTAGDDITITNDEIETIYGGKHTSEDINAYGGSATLRSTKYYYLTDNIQNMFNRLNTLVPVNNTVTLSVLIEHFDETEQTTITDVNADVVFTHVLGTSNSFYTYGSDFLNRIYYRNDTDGYNLQLESASGVESYDVSITGYPIIENYTTINSNFIPVDGINIVKKVNTIGLSQTISVNRVQTLRELGLQQSDGTALGTMSATTLFNLPTQIGEKANVSNVSKLTSTGTVGTSYDSKVGEIIMGSYAGGSNSYKDIYKWNLGGGSSPSYWGTQGLWWTKLALELVSGSESIYKVVGISTGGDVRMNAFMSSYITGHSNRIYLFGSNDNGGLNLTNGIGIASILTEIKASLDAGTEPEYKIQLINFPGDWYTNIYDWISVDGFVTARAQFLKTSYNRELESITPYASEEKYFVPGNTASSVIFTPSTTLSGLFTDASNRTATISDSTLYTALSTETEATLRISCQLNQYSVSTPMYRYVDDLVINISRTDTSTDTWTFAANDFFNTIEITASTVALTLLAGSGSTNNEFIFDEYQETSIVIELGTEVTTNTIIPYNVNAIPIDNSTIVVNNGVLEAVASAPSNMVTTDTVQTITAAKTFNAGKLRSPDVIITHPNGANSGRAKLNYTYQQNYLPPYRNFVTLSDDYYAKDLIQFCHYINSSTIQVENVGIIPCNTDNSTSALGTASKPWTEAYISDKLILSNLPTSDPQVAGQVWNDNGVLKISSGV